MKDPKLTQTKKDLVSIYNLAYLQSPLIDDVKNFDPESLLIHDRFFLFWYIDGIIRLFFDPLDDALQNPNLDSWSLYWEAGEMTLSLDLVSALADFYAQAGNANFVIALIWVRLAGDTTREEILRRFNELRTGKPFLDYVDHPVAEQVHNFLNTVGSEIRKSLKGLIPFNKQPPFQTMKLIKSLRSQFPSKVDGMAEKQQETLAMFLEYYQEIQKSIKSRRFKKILYSFTAKYRPLNNSVWDKGASAILQWDIKDTCKIYLPILSGKIEGVPSKIRDDFRTRFRRFLKSGEKNSVSLDDELWEKEASKTLFDEKERGFQGHPLSEKSTKAEMKFKEGIDPVELIKRTLRGKVKGKQFNKAIQAFQLMIAGKSQKEACKIAGLPKPSFQHYLKILKNKLSQD